MGGASYRVLNCRGALGLVELSIDYLCTEHKSFPVDVELLAACLTAAAASAASFAGFAVPAPKASDPYARMRR
jgi:hypothetical protein